VNPAKPAVLLALALAAHAKKPVTLDDIAAATPAPRPIWSPAGRYFAWQQDQAVHLYDASNRKSREILKTAPLAAAARKPPEPEAFDWENRRVSEERLQWFPSGRELLLSLSGDLFSIDIDKGKWTQLTTTPTAERDPKLSPDGRRISFRLDYDLYVLDIATRAVNRLTRDGSPTLRNAELDWVYPEELNLGTAHWWSPQSSHIAFLQFDTSRLGIYHHTDLLKLNPVHEPQRYPKAGSPNPDVRLGVISLETGRTRWMDLGETRDALIARVHWNPNGRALSVQRLNRIQNRQDLLAADIETGAARPTLRETDPYWINVKDEFRHLPTRKQFLWASEKDGYRHLYLHTETGEPIRQLTAGDWEVTDLACVNESAGRVVYTSTAVNPTERHLYSVSLDGGPATQLTRDAGTHTISMSPVCDYYVDSFSSLSTPTRRTLHRADGSETAVLAASDRKPLDDFEILPTEILTYKAPDAATLYARLIKPPNFDPTKKYPAIVMVYGGPHAQTVRDAWAGLTWDQALAHRGFVIWQTDNRGSAGRGHLWEAKLHRRLGRQELEDQKAGLNHLLSLGFVDPARVGIYGWSYGGFMTLYALLNAPDTFAAGISGAPVTDWRHYDTIYTERYLGLPQDNEQGYAASSAITYAPKLKGKLLLIHNTDDDNVLFQNTLQMMDAFQKAGHPFELMLYAQKSHGVIGVARRHLNRTMTAFFERHLK